MTDFTFTSPEGKQYKVTGPDGSTKEEAFQRLQRKLQGMPDLPAAAPKQDEAPSGFFGQLGYQLKGIPGGIARGLAGTAAASGEAAQIEMGQPVDVPGAEEGKKLIEQHVTGDLPKGGAYGEALGEVLGTPTSYLGPSGPLRALGLSGLSGLTSEAFGQATQGTQAEPIARVVGGFAPTAPYRRMAGFATAPFRGRNAAVSNRDLIRAMTEDKTTPQGMMARGENVSEVRPGMVTPADVGGQSTKDLLERIAQTPGAARSDMLGFLTQRQQGQVDRLVSGLKGMFGSQKTAFRAVAEKLAEQRKQATPAYTKAYAAGDRDIWSNELERLTGAPEIVRAMKIAQSRWRTNAIADGYGPMNPGAMVKNHMLQFTGKTLPIMPNIQFWDYTKRALGGMIENEIKENGRLTDYGRDLNNIRRQLVTELDKHVPEFAVARAKYAGPAQYTSAIEKGAELASGKFTGEEVTHMMGEFNEAEKEAARLGFIQHLVNKMGSDTAKLPDVTKYLRSPTMRDAVAAMMPDPVKAVKWRRALAFEVSQSESLNLARGGSRTARMQAEMRDASTAVDLLTDLAVASGGHPSALATGLIGSMKKGIRDRWRGGSDTRTARVLSSPAALEHLPFVVGGKDEPSLRSLYEARRRERLPRENLMPGLGPTYQAGGLPQLQQQARDTLRDKDKTKDMTTQQRQDLRAVSRGTATIDQRMRVNSFIDRFGGIGDIPKITVRPRYGGVQ